MAATYESVRPKSVVSVMIGRLVSVREADEMVRAARGPAFAMAGQFRCGRCKGQRGGQVFDARRSPLVWVDEPAYNRGDMNQQVYERTPLEQMIQEQVIDRGIRDERTLRALRAVPREKFFPQQQRDEAFADRASPIGFGQTISQPYMVALMTARLDVQPSHRVLEIGTGSGYQAAILSHLAREVFTIERVKPLLDAAWERLMELNLRNVRFSFGDGAVGWPDKNIEPFDRILIAAGAPALPRELLLNQLKDGGLAVLPIGPQNEQMLVAVTRRRNELISEDVTPVRFVRLVGKEGWPEDDAKK